MNMAAWVVSGVLGFVSGGALVWFSKDWIVLRYKKAEDFAGELEDQARSLRARLRG
jgi:phosphate/sulfate permease